MNGLQPVAKPGLRAIHLHGRLGEMFEPVYHLQVASAAEAIRALSFQLDGFRQAVADGEWVVVRGEPDTGWPLELGTMHMGLGTAPLHIMPNTVGSGGGGGGPTKMIIGVALIAVAVASFQPEIAVGGDIALGGATAGATAGGLGGASFLGLSVGQVAGMGLALTLSGISSMVSPAPKKNTSVAANSSFLFSGAQNSSLEGQPVPVVYGNIQVGSVVTATTLTTADYGSNAATTGLSANSKTGMIYSVVL